MPIILPQIKEKRTPIIKAQRFSPVSITCTVGVRLTFPKAKDPIYVQKRPEMKSKGLFVRYWYLVHYRKPEHCRVPRGLPSTIFRALGKQSICQVPSRKHSAKKGTRQTRLFAECLEVGTRQRGVCRVPRGGHSANIPFLNFLKILKIANKV